ncbi:serine dehydratase subunit alpha family protein [Psychrilyobacter atlanticus]|uniref:L-cysteine desulfidase family protein n=1 Tax=Psychrilyobacter atlanticus TaxID=271091 RepID=UPI0004267E44|nr:L-serine ammonia-lyase, iron-sulfur-dependent, subunit alpha [Psychrilyobacter atlanticus]
MDVKKIVKILSEEIVPAEGCTEPIAIAYVGAKAVEILGKTPTKLDIYVSGNMIKNVKSVNVPNGGGMVGIEVSAVMGAIAGNADAELMVISSVTPEQLEDVKEFIENKEINIIHEKTDVKLYARVIAYNGDESASVEIKHLHTNITKIEKNGETLINRACNDTNFVSTEEDRSILTIEGIYNFAKTVELSEIEDVFKMVVDYNSAIAKEGLSEKYGVNMGSMIRENMEKGIYGDDQKNRSASLAAAGSDARMAGCPLPVMTTSGSGNQGMTASLPIIQYCNDNDLSYEQMIRGLAFSHLACIHIKTNVGRLSAYCGAICASAAVSGALAFVMEESLEVVADSITNTLGNVSGMICDGAKASCAMKIASGVYAAFDSLHLSKAKKVLSNGEGIVGKDIEKTIKNIGILSQIGMNGTDETILGIMTNKY